MKKMLSIALGLAFAGVVSAADNSIYANWAWTGDEPYAKTDDTLISPLTLHTSTNATFTANPPAGKKVDSWWRHSGIGSAVSSAFTQLQSGGSTFTWIYNSAETEQVQIGVKLDWIRYTLVYSGEPETLDLLYTNTVSIADCTSSRLGYTFAQAWTNDVGNVFEKGKVVTGKNFGITNRADDVRVTLYPQWTPNRYSVKYELDGGSSGASAPESAVYDVPFVVSDPTKTGYRVLDWQADPNDRAAKRTRHGEETEFLNLTSVPGGLVTLRVVWTNCSYQVNFNNHGAESGPQSLTVEYDRGYTSVNIPRKTGHVFKGYFSEATGGVMVWDAEGQPQGLWKLTTGTVHAQWEAEQFDIAYESNGGEGSVPSQKVTYGVETVLSDGAGFSRAGCTLLGWSTSQTAAKADYALGARVAFKVKIERLYAVWERRCYVRFDGHGATSGQMPPQVLVYGKEEVLNINRFRKTGYTFGGWAESEADAEQLVAKYEDGNLIKDVSQISDIPGSTNALYAVWQTNRFVVAFDPGRGSGEMKPVPFVYDVEQALPPCAFIPPSEIYSFDSWENPLTGERIGDGAVVSNLCAEANSTNVLKAIWTKELNSFSKALHCDTLQWEVNDVGESSFKWRIDDTRGMVQSGRRTGTRQLLVASVVTNGVLSFDYCVSPWDVMVAPENQANIQIGFSTNGKNGSYGDFMDIYPAGEGWQSTNVAIRATEPMWIGIRLNVVDPDGNEYAAYIDNVVWSPEGGRVDPSDEPMTTNAVPAAVEGLIYTGSEQVGVPAGAGYWIKGNVAVDPGDYVATATPLSGNCWEGGSTAPTNVSWKISKYRKDVSGIRFEDKVFAYDGEAHEIAAEGELPDGVAIKYVGETSRTAAGTNEVKVCFSFTDPSEAELYELWPTNELSAKLIVKRARKNVDHVTFDDVIAVYDGQPHSIAVTNDLPEGVEVVYTPNDATNRVDAGTNEVTVTFKLTDPDNYEPIDKELKARLIVLKGVKDVSGVTFSDMTVEYDGEEHVLAVAGDVPDGVSVVYSGATKGTEIGTYSATAKFEVADAKNWEPIDKTLSATLRIVAPPDPTQAYEGIYFRATLEELGVSAVPTDRKVTVKAEGLPKGLKLVTTSVKDGKKVVRYEYRIEGVPTETMDGETRIAYVRVTDGKVQTLYKLDLSVKPANDYEQCSFPDATNGVAYVNYSVTKLWPDVSSNAANWTIGGLPSGLKYAQKAVTAKKKIDGVNVTVTNAQPYEVYGTPTKPGRFTVKAVEKIPGTSYKTTHVATLTVWPAAPEPEAEWTDQAYVEIANRKSADDVTKASGLPSGVKFTAKDIVSKGQVVTKAHQFYGKPTKAGTSVVTLTHEDKSKTQFFWTITPADMPEFELKLTETSVSPETAKATVLQGVAYDWAVTNTPGAKVSASGLPAGLKLVSTAVKIGGKTVGTLYAVRGVPTKEGEYFATFKTTLNGMTKVSTTAFVVKPLPDWAQGTFDGGADSSFAVGGQVTLTLSKVGKLSGKWLCEGKSWTLSAPSYDRYDETAGAYVAQLVRKTGSGKTAVIVTNELTVVEDAELVGMATNELFLAYRSNWKSEPWKTVAKGFAKGGEVVWHPHADSGDASTNDLITLKFAATGKVTVKGKFVKSVSETGKVSWHSASGSAVLCPQDAVAVGKPFDGVVFVYFPPKAKTPLEKGLAVCLAVRWNGQKFEPEASLLPDGE